MGIPVITLGGALPALLGVGLTAACAAVIRKDSWPALGRLAGALGISAGGYLVLFAILVGSWKLAPQPAARAPVAPTPIAATPVAKPVPIAAPPVAEPANPPPPISADRGPPSGVGQLPAETLTRLKNATVFIKVDTDQFSGSGSGFLMRAEGDARYVVTNDHVVHPKSDRILEGPPGRLQPKVFKNARVTVVFQSGTKEERSVPAQVLASDPSRDLALLEVNGIGEHIRPIDQSEKAELLETMPVYIFGFPFGGKLSLKEGNPTITINKGSVSSLRENEFGQLTAVQIDGAINPGNSGGPVVDEHGRLVGVAAATIRGAGIGMAIAPEELTRMLQGRIGSINLQRPTTTEGLAEVGVEIELIDPRSRIRSAFLLYSTATAPAPLLSPHRDGAFDPMPAATRLEMGITGQKAKGVLQASLGGQPPVVINFQGGYVDGEGHTHYTQVHSFRPDADNNSAVAHSPSGRLASPLSPLLPPPPLVARAPVARPPAPRPLRPLEGVTPKIQATNQSLDAMPFSVGDLQVTPIEIDAGKMPRCLCWSSDGAAFFSLEPNTGVVRRVRFPGLIEERRLQTGRIGSWLSPSREGLLLALPDLQEVWVLDERTLETKSRISAPSVDRVVSSPSLSVAFAVSGRKLNQPSFLSVLDLKRGRVYRQYLSQDLSKQPIGFDLAAATPDGKYLFGMGGIEQLHRFRISGDKLVYEESSPRIAQNGQAIEVSPDSRYVCLPSGGGNYGTSYGTFLYSVTDLHNPALTIQSGAYPRALGFDPKKELLFSQDFRHQLIVFTLGGIKQAEYELAGGGQVKQLLPSPRGGKLLVLTEHKLYLASLPEM
jgi:S1-C subfamily serine protease